MHPYIEIFGKTVGTYAICATVGMAAAVFVAWRLLKGAASVDDVILATVSIGIGMMLGSHILYALTRYELIGFYITKIAEEIQGGTFKMTHLCSAFSACFGGMVFYGGFLGGLAALDVYVRIAKVGFRSQLFDACAVCVPLFHGFGRIGCFFGGCCYGKECSVGFIAHNPLVPEMSGVRRFPIALVESTFCFLLFFVLLLLWRKKAKKGGLLFVYMLIYPAGRFVIEFFRGDAVRGIFFGLSTSQWVSIVLFAVASVRFALEAHRRKATPKG